MRKHVYNRHHLLWPRTDWRNGYAKELRNHWYLIVEIPMDTMHQAIHKEIVGIPVVDGVKAKSILQQLKLLERRNVIRSDDSIEKRLTILVALADCLSPETVEALKQQLCVAQRFHMNEPS